VNATIAHLLSVFAELSVLGFGGGKGIIPEMHAQAVGTYHWVTSEQFAQFYTIGKLIPGPTTIFAALVGYAALPQQPLLGAAVATIGMFVPSSLIVIGADHFWARFENAPWRPILAQGLAPAIVGLVWSSVWTIARGTPSGPLAYGIVAIVAVAMLRTKVSAPLLVLLAGSVGVVLLR
jgi:chromate transporter